MGTNNGLISPQYTMSPLWFILVVSMVLVSRYTAHAKVISQTSAQTISVFGAIVMMIMLIVQCMHSCTEGARGGRRERGGGGGGGQRGCHGCRGGRAMNRVLHGGGGGWTGYVPWWLYPSYYFPYGGGGGGWSPYPDLYPPGYGPSAYMPWPRMTGPCAAGCVADSTGSFGCPNPGYYPGQCRFASDCQGCAPGGVPAIAY